MHCSLRPPDVAPFVPCFNDDAPLISLQIQQFRNRQLQHTKFQQNSTVRG